MKYHFLGKTGIQVSSLCMGTMTFGREADKATSATMFQRCREVGINVEAPHAAISWLQLRQV